ncbi:hypothetical protein BGP_5592 [Beggiatoa sp. PS]|nr:hypothetical protein BGP_5592 [Beggiatoa sp. PS]
MSIYYGTVTGHTVMLSKAACLTEGMTVEVRVPSYERSPRLSRPITEIQFQQKLLELGLITKINQPSAIKALMEPILVQAKGQELSLNIIEDRR